MYNVRLWLSAYSALGDIVDLPYVIDIGNC